MDNLIEILLVEDSPSDIRLTEEALKRSGLKYSLSIANDGVEAVEHLKSEKSKQPDLILLDLNMPRKNGHEVLAEIKQDARLRAIPVILMTVSQRDEDVMEALKLKMNYYVAKPVTSQKLTVLIKSIYEIHQESGGASTTDNEEAHVRMVLAGNPHTSGSVLAKLAGDASERVRMRVAENPETPKDVLVRLARDESAEVRQSLPENPHLPPELLAELAKDESEDVRLSIAGNDRVPTHILEQLAEDTNTFVASCAQKTLLQLMQSK